MTNENIHARHQNSDWCEKLPAEIQVLGQQSDAFDAMMVGDFTFLLLKNNYAEKWIELTIPMVDFANGAEIRYAKNRKKIDNVVAFDGTKTITPDGDHKAVVPGLVHKERSAKDGAGIVARMAADGERRDSKMTAATAIILDVDDGNTLDEVRAAVLKSSKGAIIWTSHNHMNPGYEIEYTKLDGDFSERNATLEDAQDYFRAQGRSEEWVQQLQVHTVRYGSHEKPKIRLIGPPAHKCRVMFMLDMPFPLDAAGRKAFPNLVSGWADALGLKVDPCCFKLNQLMYLPSAPSQFSERARTYIVQGEPLSATDITPGDSKRYGKLNDFENPFAMISSTGAEGSAKPTGRFMTAGGIDLAVWDRTYGQYFPVADYYTNSANGTDKIAVDCPFCDGGSVIEGVVHAPHSDGRDGGAWMRNPDPDADGPEGIWMVDCSHTHNPDRLEYILMMLERSDCEESDLTDFENWGLDDESLAALQAQVAQQNAQEPASLDPDEVAEAVTDAGIGKKSKEGDIREFMSGFLQADMTTQNNITDALAGVSGARGKQKEDAATNLSRKQVEAIWAELEHDCVVEAAQAHIAKRNKRTMPDFVPLADATEESVMTAAEASKWLGNFIFRNGYFGTYDYASEKFYPVSPAFEVVYSADGDKGKDRTNQTAIRYVHRNPAYGVVDSTFRKGDMYRDTGTVLGRLADEGLDFVAAAKTEEIMGLMRSIDCERNAVFCQRAGFVTPDRDVFVTVQGHNIKKDPDNKTLYVLDKDMVVGGGVKGTVEECAAAWAVAVSGKNGDRFLPGSLGGAVGTLAAFVGTEQSVVVNNEGKAKHGKTTALKAGVAFHAAPTPDGLLFSADATEAAIEEKAAQASGAMMAPDEEGANEKTAEDVQRQIYKFAGGSGRVRAKPGGGTRETREWQGGCMGQSNERGLTARMEAEGTDVKSGALSRVFVVNYDRAVWLNKHNPEDAKVLAAYDVLAHEGAYGVMNVPYVRELMEWGVEKAKERIRHYELEWGAGSAGAAERVVTTGALFAVAAEVCQDAGLLPENDATLNLQDMLKVVMDEALEDRARYLDTERQELDAFHLSVIRAINRGQIIGPNDDPAASHVEVLGFYKEGKGVSDFEANDDEITASMLARTYIVPVDRLPQLGVKITPEVLAERLKDADALVTPKEGSKYSDKGLWETTPGVGKRVKSLRFTGAWVHGEAPPDDTDEPNGGFAN